MQCRILASFWNSDPPTSLQLTRFRIRCIGQSDCCQKRCLTQALNWCLTLETIVSCRIWQILNPSKCHITNSRMVLMEESFLTCKKIRLLQFCDSGRNMKWRCPQIYATNYIYFTKNIKSSFYHIVSCEKCTISDLCVHCDETVTQKKEEKKKFPKCTYIKQSTSEAHGPLFPKVKWGYRLTYDHREIEMSDFLALQNIN